MGVFETVWLPYTSWLVPTVAIAGFAVTWCTQSFALHTCHVIRAYVRGSHTHATPVGGGIGFVNPITLAWAAISRAWNDYVLRTPALVSAALTVMGYLDDRPHIVPGIRLMAQAAAATAIATLILWRSHGGQGMEHPRYIAGAASMLAWRANLFSCIDDIDGLCSTGCLYIARGGLAVSAITGGPTLFLLALAVLAAGLVGFLPYNAAPTKIFMGDSSST